MKFSATSLSRLQTVHPDLQTVANYVIQFVDFSVIWGKRTTEQQFTLFQKGRMYLDGKWIIIEKDDVVTYCDGCDKKSKHQSGEALDIVFYRPTEPHIIWKGPKAERANYYLMGAFIGAAEMLYKYGAIDSDIISGGNWDDDGDLEDQTFMDVFHFERKQ